MKTLKDLDLKGKRVLLRADFNVPVNGKGEIEDDNRIKASIPSINFILEHGGSVIIISHFGRPKGKPDPEFSLEFIAERLSELLGKEVEFAKDCIGPETKKIADDLKPGQVLLLENTRFYKEEKENDPEFSKKLAELGDIYVNDAFGTAHRAHASTEGVAKLLPHGAGLLLEKEVNTLTKIINNPEHPVVAIIGGAKISTKIQLIKSMLEKVLGCRVKRLLLLPGSKFCQPVQYHLQGIQFFPVTGPVTFFQVLLGFFIVLPGFFNQVSYISNNRFLRLR